MNRITIGEKHYPVKLSQKALKRFEEITGLSYLGLIEKFKTFGTDEKQILAFMEEYGMILIKEALNSGKIAAKLYGEDAEDFPFTVDEMGDLFSYSELGDLVKLVLSDLSGNQPEPEPTEAKKKPIAERLRGK